MPKNLTSENWQRVTQRDLVAILDLTPATVNSWRKKGMPVIEESGRTLYSPAAVFQWKIGYEKDKVKTATTVDGDLGGESSDALEAYRKVKTQEAQFNLDVKKGLFVERSAYEETLRRASVYARKYLQNLGKLLGVKLAKMKKPVEITKTIEDEIEGILKKMVEEYTPS